MLHEHEEPEDAPKDNGFPEDEDLPDAKSEGLPTWVWIAAGSGAIVLMFVILACCGAFSSDVQDSPHNPIKNNDDKIQALDPIRADPDATASTERESGLSFCSMLLTPLVGLGIVAWFNRDFWWSTKKGGVNEDDAEDEQNADDEQNANDEQNLEDEQNEDDQQAAEDDDHDDPSEGDNVGSEQNGSNDKWFSNSYWPDMPNLSSPMVYGIIIAAVAVGGYFIYWWHKGKQTNPTDTTPIDTSKFLPIPDNYQLKKGDEVLFKPKTNGNELKGVILFVQPKRKDKPYRVRDQGEAGKKYYLSSTAFTKYKPRRTHTKKPNKSERKKYNSDPSNFKKDDILWNDNFKRVNKISHISTRNGEIRTFQKNISLRTHRRDEPFTIKLRLDLQNPMHSANILTNAKEWVRLEKGTEMSWKALGPDAKAQTVILDSTEVTITDERYNSHSHFRGWVRNGIVCTMPVKLNGKVVAAPIHELSLK